MTVRHEHETEFQEALREASISIACALDEVPSTEDLEHIQTQITILENRYKPVALLTCHTCGKVRLSNGTWVAPMEEVSDGS